VPKNLKLPDQQQLPPGAWRTFTEELFFLYREAGRPTLREIAEAVNKIDERAGTASHETLRKALLGIAVPRRWWTVEAMVLGLCKLAQIDPNSSRYEDAWDDGDPSYLEAIKNAWNLAIDEGKPWPMPPQAGFDETPPF
jgi:hypothetical protein